MNAAIQRGLSDLRRRQGGASPLSGGRVHRVPRRQAVLALRSTRLYLRGRQEHGVRPCAFSPAEGLLNAAVLACRAVLCCAVLFCPLRTLAPNPPPRLPFKSKRGPCSLALINSLHPLQSPLQLHLVATLPPSLSPPSVRLCVVCVCVCETGESTKCSLRVFVCVCVCRCSSRQPFIFSHTI